MAQADDRTVEDSIKEILSTFTKQYGKPSCGRNRAAFDSGRGFVIKVPLHMGGITDNEREIKNYDSFVREPEKWGDVKLAKCYMVELQDIPLIYMEKVNYRVYEPMPNWASFIDCMQVGYNKAGELVAYDYGNL